MLPGRDLIRPIELLLRWVGVGSDIGGSIRIPAAFCGIYGFRPSYNRIPYAGCANSMEGQDSVPSVLGPLSNTLEGIKIFFKAVLSERPWLKDAMVIRKHWSEEEYKLVDHGNGGKLCFAIMWDDGVIAPHPPILRGLAMTKKALLAAGHQVIDWKPHKHAEISQTIGAIWKAGALEDYKTATAPSGEPIISSMGIIPEDVELAFRTSPKAASAFELWQIQKKKRDLRQEYLELWAATISQTDTGRPVDAVICPVAPYTAPPHGLNKSAQYTMSWNLLDYPALVVPVAKVDPVLDVKQTRNQFYSEADRENYELYDPATYHNAPASIQVVGRTSEDEAVIAMSEVVDQALRMSKSKL